MLCRYYFNALDCTYTCEDCRPPTRCLVKGTWLIDRFQIYSEFSYMVLTFFFLNLKWCQFLGHFEILPLPHMAEVNTGPI